MKTIFPKHGVSEKAGDMTDRKKSIIAMCTFLLFGIKAYSDDIISGSIFLIGFPYSWAAYGEMNPPVYSSYASVYLHSPYIWKYDRLVNGKTLEEIWTREHYLGIDRGECATINGEFIPFDGSPPVSIYNAYPNITPTTIIPNTKTGKYSLQFGFEFPSGSSGGNAPGPTGFGVFCDSTAPSIFSTDIKQYYNGYVSFNYSFADQVGLKSYETKIINKANEESKVKAVSIKILPIPPQYEPQVIPAAVLSASLSDGKYYVTFDVCDVFDNAAVWGTGKEYSFMVDTVAPTVSSVQLTDAPVLHDNVYYYKDTESSIDVSFSSFEATSGSGISNYMYCIVNTTTGQYVQNGSIAGTSSSINIENLAKNTKYLVGIKSRDKAGNESEWINSPGFIIYSGTVSTPALSATLTSSDNHISGISLSWAAPASVIVPIEKYEVFEGKIGSTTAKLGDVSTGGAYLIEHSFVDADRGSRFEYYLRAVDVLGNTGDSAHILVNLPVFIKASIENNDMSFTDPSNKLSSLISVKLEFNVSLTDMKSRYSSFSIKHTGGGYSSPSTTTITTANISISSGGLWSQDDDGLLIYEDILPASSGHKEIVYSFSQTPSQEAITAVQETNPDTVTQDLPNHPGRINGIRLSDSHGHSILDSDVPGTSPLIIDESLHANVSIRASDVDGDAWKYLVHSAKLQIEDPPIYDYARISGDQPFDYAPPASPGSAWSASIPVTLTMGMNNIMVKWEELSPQNWGGGLAIGGNSLAQEGADVVLHINVRRESEHFYIDVLSGFEDVGGAVIVRPGEALEVEVFPKEGESDTWHIDWDFGDGYEIDGVSLASHAYDQGINQQTDASAYTLMIEMTSLSVPALVDSYSIPIQVKDTQNGVLHKSETWRGPHEITGKVIVPSGMTLRIEQINATAANRTRVDFKGGLTNGNAQGIVVNPGGSLEIDGFADAPIVMRRPSEALDEQGTWNTIRIEGSAIIENAVIRDAERALAVLNGGNLALDDSEISANGIGLHAVGAAAQITVSGTAFSDNGEYGVKEDADAEPAFDETVTFSDNFWDYYDDERGILTPHELTDLLNGVVDEGE